jgi:glucosamine kinase
VRVGGWGHIVDDRGSAYDIGRDALYAAMRDYDGRGPKTKLLPMLMHRLKVKEAQGVIAKVYPGHMPVSEIASLSTLVATAAEAGDRVSQEILEAKGKILAELVVSAASQLKMLDLRFGVSLNGGVFKAGPHVLRPMEDAIRAKAPHARVVEPKLPPACGALILLFRRAGIEVGPATLARMKSSLKRVA